ncbi:MAG: hypothetical protein ACXADB_09625 [Candidatus Hermodarchaeia archaeon]|jgi:hypothetical protein
MSKGIITIAGKPEYFFLAYVNCKLIRSYGCNLPIEWFYFGPEMSPLMLDMAEEIRDLLCIDLVPIVQGLYTWQARTFVAAESSFDEFLFLDADSFPTRSPEPLFECQEYLNTGALFWPSTEKWSPEDMENFEKIFGTGTPEIRVDLGQTLSRRQQDSFYIIEKPPVVVDCGLKQFGPDGKLSFIHMGGEIKSIPATKDMEMMMDRLDLTEEDLEGVSCRICTEWEELLYED